MLNLLKPYIPLQVAKYFPVFIAMSSGLAHATPTNMGVFSDTSSLSLPGGGAAAVTGKYTTAGGATGTFKLTRNSATGYDGAEIKQENGSVKNGLEIKNRVNQASNNDQFNYTFEITPNKPDDKNFIHIIKIAQATYDTTGNSEPAKQTISFQTPLISFHSMSAEVSNNESVPYHYNAMGDYITGTKNPNNTFTDNSNASGQQLRQDDSGEPENKLYYFKLADLKGANSSPYTISTPIGFKANKKGQLPNPVNFNNLLKSSAQPTTYKDLASNFSINSGGTFVSYGVANANSTYVISINNATQATVNYKGIMNGHIGGSEVGETYNEWITFGVASVPITDFYYTFSGFVFNDNGGISDSLANSNEVNAPYKNNAAFFNGKKDSNELGISGITIALTQCNNPSTVLATAITGTDGAYSFTIPKTVIAENTDICLSEVTPPALFPISTTVSKIQRTVSTATPSFTNLDFGHVANSNAALVLKKYHYVHDCNTNLDYSQVPKQATSALVGFSMASISNVEAGKCIAYQIEAYNRANLDLTQVQIFDTLNKSNEGQSVFYAPLPTGVTSTLYSLASTSSPTIGLNEHGTIISAPFDLQESQQNSPKMLFFNSKFLPKLE